MSCRIDHLTITAPSLEAGREWVLQRLGVAPQNGGEHPRMGTHNLLLRLGDAMFLEVIAVNPAAPKPSRPRWFELDSLSPSAPPGLACWVARTDDIGRSTNDVSGSLGAIEPMTRGTLEWLISVPEDGSLPMDGAAPMLIQWHSAVHPASAMQDQGCELVALTLSHPEPEAVEALLSALDLAEPRVSLSVKLANAPGLKATIRTPHGVRTLEGTA